MDFNPNKKPSLKEWATYIPTRSTQPKFKMHSLRSHALNAIGLDDAILFRWQDGEWKEVWRQEEAKKQAFCGNCGKDTTRTLPHSGTWFNGEVVWVNKHKDIPDRMFVCYDCKRKVK